MPLVSVVPGTKFVPATVIEVAADPAVTELGLSDVILGPTTVRVLAEETAVTVFCTVTLRLPGVVMEVAGMVAVIDVAVAEPTVNCVVPR